MGLPVRDKPFPRVCWRVSSAEPCRVKAGAVTPNAALFYINAADEKSVWTAGTVNSDCMKALRICYPQRVRPAQHKPVGRERAFPPAQRGFGGIKPTQIVWAFCVA